MLIKNLHGVKDEGGEEFLFHTGTHTHILEIKMP
jgi:hypothetical protein